MSSSAMDATDAIKPVRACIFDVDGLLINSEDIYTEAYNNILQRYGRPDLPWTVKARQQSRGREVSQNEAAHVTIIPLPSQRGSRLLTSNVP